MYCGNPVAYHGTFLKCDKGHKFPCINGVPIFRDNICQDSVIPKGGDEFCHAGEILDATTWKSFLLRIFGTNYVPYPVLPSDFIKPEYQVLNVGCGMKERFTPNTTNLDYYLFPKVDIVASASKIPFMDDTFDIVISEFLLEHTPNPFTVCQEMLRVLKLGGILYISYPFIHSYHSFPKDYFRFTYMGLREMLPGTEVELQGPLTGTACRWIAATADLVSCLLSVGPKTKTLLRFAVLFVLFPLKYLDLVLNRRSDSLNHAITLYGVFRKKESSVFREKSK